MKYYYSGNYGFYAGVKRDDSSTEITEEAFLIGTADSAPATPEFVTPRQAKLALLSAGLLDDVEAAIEAIPDPATRRVAQIEWEYAQEVRRDWPLLNAVAAQMGMTSEQIDELFSIAATL